MLTTAQAALLTATHLDVSAGCEVLNLDLTLATSYGVDGGISADLVGGSVSRHMNAKIHGTCRLDLTVELPWGSVLVRPYMIVNGERFDGGVYMLTTPESPIGETPATFSAQGFDRVYLLDREVGRDYSLTVGTTYYDALVQVFSDAGLTGFHIDGAAVGFTLPVDREWPLVATSTDPDQTDTPVTWLRIINDLLGAINFRGVYADASGVYRCQQYLGPEVRSPVFTFDADDVTVDIVGERSRLYDIYKTPNQWVFLWSNRPGGEQDVEGDGMYTVDNLADGATSQVARGLVWTKVFRYEAASQAALQSLGDRRVAADLRVSETWRVTTDEWPAAGHFDVFTYRDVAAGGERRVQALEWEYDLTGGRVSWLWETV